MVKELICDIVKQFVHNPDKVAVEAIKNPDGVLLEINVDEADRGKVIGKSGLTIKALRMLAHALAPADTRITVDIAK